TAPSLHPAPTSVDSTVALRALYDAAVLLTIGVPTYNRAASVSRLVGGLLAAPAADLVEVLVIDDGDDGTHAALAGDATIASRIRLLKNEVSLGYPGTFARMFAECTTEYLMIVADDVEVIVDEIAALAAYLERERPAFASPQFLRDALIYRGRSDGGPIAPHDFLAAAAHASGLVYRVADCRDAISDVERLVACGEAAALIYPQVLVLMDLLIKEKKCEWIGLPAVAEGTREPSGIRDPNGGAYWFVESRWKQLTSFDRL